MDDIIAELRAHIAPTWEREFDHARTLLQLLCEEMETKNGNG